MNLLCVFDVQHLDDHGGGSHLVCYFIIGVDGVAVFFCQLKPYFGLRYTYKRKNVSA